MAKLAQDGRKRRESGFFLSVLRQASIGAVVAMATTMQTTTAAFGRAVRRLAAGDQGRRAWADVRRAALGAALLTLASWTKVPLLTASVPLTWQPQAVLWLAAQLGGRPAVGAVVLWLTLAARGLPVLASGGGPGALFGPAFGYVASYLLVAPLVGRFGRGHGLAAFGCWLLAGALTLLGGALGLRALSGSWALAWQLGVAPFWLADSSKITAVFVLRALARPGSRSS